MKTKNKFNNIDEVEKGMKVTYVTSHKIQIGIVKSISDENHVFVVYHCAENWDDYENYTAARTRLEDLRKGWDKDL